MTVSFLACDIRLFSLLYKFSSFNETPDFGFFHRPLPRVFVPLFDGIPANDARVVWAISIQKPRFGISPSTIYLELFFDLSQVFSILLFITDCFSIWDKLFSFHDLFLTIFLFVQEKTFQNEIIYKNKLKGIAFVRTIAYNECVTRHNMLEGSF